MDTLNIIKPATLQEPFGLRPAKSTNIIEKDFINYSNISHSINPIINNIVISSNLNTDEYKPFIEANTHIVDLNHLTNDCIIPVFSKDNEKTIAHQEFINITQDCIAKIFPHHSFNQPEIRVSHPIKGRTPDAIYKNVKDLLDHEKTQYYERMAFIIKIPTITDTIKGNELSLTIGGVRAYNQENLYNKKTFERFKFFIGFQNKVCCNLCVSSDGLVDDMRVSSYQELQGKITKALAEYNAEKHLQEMKELTDSYLTEHQFAQLLGKARLYQHLSKGEKQRLNIPQLTFNDSQLSTVAKDYYDDESFCRDDAENINLWSVYNLFTQANKSSYIDTFLDRNLNAFEFTKGIQKTLNDNSNYHWFLS
ncbi:DUF3871 family protein [Chryseobacterium fistulae]|uniref:DUF3871 family protein n=1 Tax=Chryseobacterium fistulae TaxID=2675058 RepID=A0A6N4XQL8_9FLAO|nr:DUF3871 family protein [Chryseobacterium fistulae]CAA7386961.1 hypothetical protein CHRY9393_01262 [Chryseobacterium fistulae]